MDWGPLLESVGIYGTTIILCFISGVLPILHVEAFLVTVSALSSQKIVIPLIIVASTVSILAKSLVYLTARGVLNLPLKKYEEKLEPVRRRIERWRAGTMVLLLISACTGMPPFYLMTILSGTMKYNFIKYFLCGVFGLAVRYALVIEFPQLLKRLF